MRIALISNGAMSLENFRGPLMREMVRRGHEVLAFAPDFSDASRSRLREMGVVPLDCRMARAGTNPLQELATVLELRRLLQKHRPDLCLSYMIKPVIYGTIASWMARVGKRYAMIEGLGFSFSNEAGALQSIVSRLLRFSVTKAHGLIFLNNDDQATFADKGILGGRLLILGGIGVDLEEWTPASFPDGPMTFVMVARILRDKGVEDYVAASRIVRKKYPQTRFLLVGGLDDNPSGIAEREVVAWRDEGLVDWPGHVEVRPWLARSHVFVLPSYREGVPRSTQEAMAVGRPVITTDVPGCRDTVIDAITGFLVPPRNPEALAAAMCRFLQQPALVSTMGQDARRMAERVFDVKTQNSKLLDFLEVPNAD
ncbi:MAG: glycosyltransferase family 4 protein [Mesorhizobium sp.]|uniref:glycosyltransferase family 4 protein n=1 Tax=Mesorhizobium sp. TaxID=1871066 RepID=UPI0011FD1C84|nr:glycosyltransferase family 4 protein [Mesorhizobium sp.]TIP05721.1 MAG: glycosyltransferase family 4 protein [Mesorhizobium sp.]